MKSSAGQINANQKVTISGSGRSSAGGRRVEHVDDLGRGPGLITDDQDVAQEGRSSRSERSVADIVRQVD